MKKKKGQGAGDIEDFEPLYRIELSRIREADNAASLLRCRYHELVPTAALYITNHLCIIIIFFSLLLARVYLSQWFFSSYFFIISAFYGIFFFLLLFLYIYIFFFHNKDGKQIKHLGKAGTHCPMATAV